MALSLSRLVQLRPFAFHLTSRGNLQSIRNRGRLLSTSELLTLAKRPELVRDHRPRSIYVQIGRERIQLRDQAPLKRGNVSLTPAWHWGDVLELLNGRVFFWPGTATGPISSGVRHFQRYAKDDVAILRVPTSDLLRANPATPPEFCRWNSGAPRWSRGRRPVRDANTFVRAEWASYTAAAVVEITFPRAAILPPSTRVAGAAMARWTAF